MQYLASLPIDANYKPVQVGGFMTASTKTLSGSNTTVAVPIFSITGQIEVAAIWGVVTTALGSNITAAYWRLNDATNQSDITLNTGTTLSSAVAGSMIGKKGLANAALTFLSAATEIVTASSTTETMFFSPFLVLQKTGGVTTNIEFVYTTTNTPTSGVIDFYVRWLPLSATATVTAI